MSVLYSKGVFPLSVKYVSVNFGHRCGDADSSALSFSVVLELPRVKITTSSDLNEKIPKFLVSENKVMKQQLAIVSLERELLCQHTCYVFQVHKKNKQDSINTERQEESA